MSFSRAYRRPSRPVAPDVQELRDRHMLAPESDPGLHLVGDYLFDCTINGVFDSAEYVSEAILSEWRQRVYNETVEEATSALVAAPMEAGPLGSDYFDFYDGESPYEESFEEHFDETYTIDLIRTIFRHSPPYRLLDCGSRTHPGRMARTEHLWGRAQAAVRRRVLRFCLRDLPLLPAGSGSRHCDRGIVPGLPRWRVFRFDNHRHDQGGNRGV